VLARRVWPRHAAAPETGSKACFEPAWLEHANRGQARAALVATKKRESSMFEKSPLYVLLVSTVTFGIYGIIWL
jgi:hypothetical protein